jgi:periplasmic copper chaperone A
MFNNILMPIVVLIFASQALGYFTATATTNDAITSTTSDCCKAVEIHRTEKLNGIMSMRRIAQMTLSKNKPTQVQPDAKGGEHIMFIGLKQPLREGDTVKVNFTFSKAPPQTVVFPVKSASSKPTVHELH